MCATSWRSHARLATVRIDLPRPVGAWPSIQRVHRTWHHVKLLILYSLWHFEPATNDPRSEAGGRPWPSLWVSASAGTARPRPLLGFAPPAGGGDATRNQRPRLRSALAACRQDARAHAVELGGRVPALLRPIAVGSLAAARMPVVVQAAPFPSIRTHPLRPRLRRHVLPPSRRRRAFGRRLYASTARALFLRACALQQDGGVPMKPSCWRGTTADVRSIIGIGLWPMARSSSPCVRASPKRAKRVGPG